MSPFFRRKKEEKLEEEEAKQGRIREILANERVLKKEEYEGGRIWLTEIFLLWEKKEKSNSAIIPREEIRKVEQVVKFRKGMGMEVTCGDGRKHFFPFMTRLWVNPAKKAEYHTNYFNGVHSWIATLETGIPSTVFLHITYKGGHSSYKAGMGNLTITPTTLVFRGGGTPLEIPLEKIENISMEREGKSKLLLLLGVGGALSYLSRKNYLLIEYKDEQDLKQTPILDFSPDNLPPLFAKDLDDRRKIKVIETVKEYLKKREET